MEQFWMTPFGNTFRGIILGNRFGKQFLVAILGKNNNMDNI